MEQIPKAQLQYNLMFKNSFGILFLTNTTEENIFCSLISQLKKEKKIGTVSNADGSKS
jgi:hypothetical protein